MRAHLPLLMVYMDAFTVFSKNGFISVFMGAFI